MLKLTLKNVEVPTVIYINPLQVVEVFKRGGTTKVVTTHDTWEVNEQPEDIANQMRDLLHGM